MHADSGSPLQGFRHATHAVQDATRERPPLHQALAGECRNYKELEMNARNAVWNLMLNRP